MAIAGVTVAAAVSIGGGVAAAWPAAVSGTAFDRLQAGGQPDAATRSLNSLRLTDLAAKAARERAYTKAVAARLARAAARRAAARRAAARRAAAAAAAQAAQATQAAPASAQVAIAPAGQAQQIAARMLASFGWSSSQFSCLEPLWAHESGWSVTATNPSSGAYGIPQALPGSKMASAGADWQTSAATQIRWGLGYIRSTYGSPCAAWSHEQATGWY
jgi:hypothetical protein